MKKLFSKILKQLSDNNDVVLCVIRESSGSTPRKAGAMMACFSDGTTVGTVGGGLVEYECTLHAKDVMKEKRDSVKEYALDNRDAGALGMVCGGMCQIYFHYIKSDENNISVFERICGFIDNKNRAWMVAVSDDNQSEFSVYSEEFGYENIKEPQENSCDFNSAFSISENKKCYAVPLFSSRVYVFGGGHVSQALCPVLLSCGFDVTVYEDSEKFADKSLFPSGTEIVNSSFLKINESVDIKNDDYVVVLTRGHKSDNDVLKQILSKNPFYLGVIGSKKKVKFMSEYLFDCGFEKEQVEKIYSPIGFEIGAQTPSEIAVSITAQLIAKRAGVI